MPTTTTATRRPDTPTARRGAAALAALALAVGAALVAAGPAAASAASGGDLDLAGDPLVHTFDLDRPGDSVTGEWTVTARTERPVGFDGVLRPDGEPDRGLAAALTVEYGAVGADGAVAGWHPAGTLAAPRSYADALGADPVAQAGEPVVIPVRVSLPDPSLVTGEPGRTVQVEASFTVTYLAPGGGGGGAGGGAGGDVTAGGAGRGPLALTGADAWWLAALAAAALGTGAALVRRRRDAREEHAPAAG
jgi:LPXTG-motif cell wall-anchored protein